MQRERERTHRITGALVAIGVLVSTCLGLPARAAFPGGNGLAAELGAPQPIHLKIDDLGRVVAPPWSTTSLIAAFGDVWVTYFRRRGFVARIDGKTGLIVDRIPVPWVPDWETGGGGMTVADGAVWIAGIDGPAGGNIWRDGKAALFRVDPSTDGVTTFDLGGRVAIDVTTDGSSLIVAALIRRGPTPRAEILRVDPSTGHRERIARVDATWERTVLAVEGSVWLSERETHGSVVCCPSVVPVVPALGTSPMPVTVGGSFAEPVNDGTSLWVATGPNPNVVNLSSWLSRIDPLSGDVTGSWNLHTSIGYDIEAGGGSIWVITYRNGQPVVERFDQAIVEVTSFARIRGTPTALAAGDGVMWVLTYEGHLMRIHAP